MNEQLPISLPMTAVGLPERAQRIRDLVGVARTCIIEIGRELIAAKAEVLHGEWLRWINDEFGWTASTAQRYMQVASAFQMPHAARFDGLAIDATALYALAAPDVPQEARDEALSRVADGEHVTKTEADDMVKRAVEVKVAEAIAKVREEQKAATREAIEQATRRLEGDKAALAEEIAEIKKRAKADAPAMLSAVEKTLKVRKLSADQCRLVAQLLGKAIRYGGQEYHPVSREQIQENDEWLRKTAAVAEAISALKGAPPADLLLARCYPAQRAVIAEAIEQVITWAGECRKAGRAYAGEKI